MPESLCLNFDDAWDAARLPIPTLDLRLLGPQLRYTAPDALYHRAFADFRPHLQSASFILYGSGDFHHLAAGFLQACLDRNPSAPPLTLVSFDNHPDWDIRPPRWGCGGWINRALELPRIQKAAVWGCGNFELAFPARLFRNRRALAAGRLEVHAWAQRQSPATARRFNCMTAENWHERFSRFAESLKNTHVYVTIDMDCLTPEHAATSWEAGLFTPDDLVWALAELRRHAPILGGDLCGAFSPQAYARPWQRRIARFDHPRLPPITLAHAQQLNHPTLDILWPALSTT